MNQTFHKQVLFSDILFLRYLKLPLQYLAAMGAIAVLPQSSAIFGLTCAGVIYYCFNNPIRVLYTATSILTMRYFFVNIPTPTPILAPWRIRGLGDIFIQSSDEFVFILLLAGMMFQFFRSEINPLLIQEKKRLNMYVALLLIIIIFSALANQVSPVSTFFFAQIFLRPILFLMLIISIQWKSQELLQYFVFTFSLIFFMQVIPSFIENIPALLSGQIFFIDLFVGTFVYHFNPITVQLLFYAFCFLFVNYIQFSTRRNFWFLLLCFFSIISCQSGLQTIVVMVGLLIFLALIFIMPSKLNLPVFKSKAVMMWAGGILSVIVIGIILLPSLPGYELLVGYSQYQAELALEEGLAETPKIRTYSILWDYIDKGEINPFIGAGPAQYLSDAAGLAGNKYMNDIVGNSFYFSKSLLNGVLAFPYNNFIGIVGEIGLIGYINVILIYMVPLRFVWRNLRYYRGSFWAVPATAFIGIFLCMITWSFFWNVFENVAMSIFYLIFGGILMYAQALLKQEYYYGYAQSYESITN